MGGMRIAAIDLGTNSIHMVIASATSSTGFDVVDREREVIQIGRGSFTRGRLRVDAIRRASDALARYVSLARRHHVDRIVCTATAAVREARNGGDFLRAAREASGITPRVIPPSEETRLIYLGVRSALQLDDAPSLIVDIGGGSMQLAVGNRERLLHAASAPLGALRLTETMLPSDPPSKNELQKLRRHIRRLVRGAMEGVEAHAPRQVYGSSGSIHALAQAAHWMETGQPIRQINGHVLATDALELLARRLQQMRLDERRRVPGIDAPRAGIIVPGALVLLQVLRQAGADGITISDYGVREGLVMDYIAFHAREITALEQVEDLRLRSVLQLLAKFQSNDRHPLHVAHLALELFDGLGRVHGMGADERRLLHYAALLHDVGSTIRYDGHGEHSAYIIRNGSLRGLSEDEVAVVANVARYHGKRRPRKRDEAYAALSRGQRRTVRWLAALLRIAEGLDRSHYQLIRDVRVVRRGERIAILASAARDARLELWAARDRTGYLERVSGMTVAVRRDPARSVPAAAPRPRARVAGAGRRGVVLPMRPRR